MNPLQKKISEINAKGLLFRTAQIERVKAADGAESDSYELSFSSEDPYERFFGIEVLGHKKEEVDLSWLAAGTAPLLLEHERDEQIGVVDKASLKDRRGIAVVRFGNTALAKEIKADVDAKIRSNVSVGYEVIDMVLTKDSKDGLPEYRVTRWKPLEVSIVSLPADTTVGVGRGHFTPPANPQKEPTMEPKTDEIKASTEKALAQERARVNEITTLAKTHGFEDAGTAAVQAGTDLEAFRKDLLAKILERTKAAHGGAQGQGVFTGSPTGGLSKQDRKDVKRYSFVRAINAMATGRQLEGVEKEMHEEGVKDSAAMGMETKGLNIPLVVLTRADLTVADDGANTVQTTVMSDFIGALRNRIVLAGLGARFMTGLRGNVTLPKISAGSSATWEGENDAGSESEPTTAKVSLSPKRLGLYSEVSKQLLLQTTPDVERMLREDMVMAIALGIDQAGISGPGSGGAPTGILATSGIGSVAGGTNGAAPTLANIIALETAVSVANAPMDALSYLTNAKVRGKLKATAAVSSTDSRMVWGSGEQPLNGYGAVVTNAVPSDLTKGTASGVCSAIIFGNFSDLIIGQWGGLDLVVDPYTLATTGMVRLVINTWADVAVRYAASFAAMQDALTT